MSFYRILPSPFASSVFYIAYTYRIESITLQSEMNTYKQPEMIIAIIAQYVKIMYDNKPVIRIELNSLLGDRSRYCAQVRARAAAIFGLGSATTEK